MFGLLHPANRSRALGRLDRHSPYDGHLPRHRQKHNRCWTSCGSSGGDPMIPHAFSLTPQHSFISQRSGWTRTSNP
ncbi:hypothetical protein R3I93_019602 [Phoxinus phoxinus]|uniref:Uncharacterized protein n=1 Tax=Phoxinus phoxinus TaxID=58324 RepID=A0AAN9GVG8_9TELE